MILYVEEGLFRHLRKWNLSRRSPFHGDGYDWLTDWHPLPPARSTPTCSVGGADILVHLTKLYELQLTVKFEMLWLWMGCTLEAIRKHAAELFILELHSVNSKWDLSGNRPLGWDTRPPSSLKLECTNPGRHTVATTFCTMVHNICESTVWNLSHVTCLAPSTLRCLLDFQKSVHSCKVTLITAAVCIGMCISL
jgi:hypothetical protein